MDQLIARLQDISTPGSPDFGKHMTHEEIAAVTATDASARAVTEYLESKGAQILSSTQHGEYITASWTIENWEKLLANEFHEFVGSSKPVFRSFEYTIPEELETHVHSVLNVLEVMLPIGIQISILTSFAVSRRSS